MKHPRPERSAIAAAMIFCGCLVAVATPARSDGLAEVLAAFDDAQSSVRTLSASFVQTTSIPMLTSPILAEGRFFMTKPDAIRWEYTTPEEMSFVIANDHYTGYYPARKQAEKKNVQRYGKKIFRYFGMGEKSSELAETYEISLANSDESGDGFHVLVLEPRKRRAKKKVDEVRFWLDRSTYLPFKVEYLGHDGSIRIVEFTKVDVNPDLSASLFNVEIPADVTVTNGFSGIPTFDAASSP